jgi:hypothetical protein
VKNAQCNPRTLGRRYGNAAVVIDLSRGELTVNGQSNHVVFHIPLYQSPAGPAFAVFSSRNLRRNRCLAHHGVQQLRELLNLDGQSVWTKDGRSRFKVKFRYFPQKEQGVVLMYFL